ncbi:MAG: PD-(D/E)XK nuclease family protein [Clostridia bacterium]|nr:PD-(D/E)XK nuclease family protein [Clostridia bacterium]
MLNFILGRASTGKTYTVLSKIAECVKNGGEPILVVPEQFSFESEKAILELLGDSGSSKVSVLPFTRIYETIGRIKGGICGKTVNGADKHILMGRAVNSVQNELILWGGYASSGAFHDSMIKVIDEFKYNAVSSEDLRNASKCEEGTRLSQKLNDTALIMDSYTALLGTNFIDPSDYMDKLYYMLENCDFFVGKQVFFDGFKSFSGQQFKVIDRIIAKAQNVTFSFCDAKNDTRELDLFSNIRETKRKIENIAKAHNVKIAEPTYLDKPRYENSGLESFEECMFSGDFNCDADMKEVTVCAAETIFDEAEFVARNIRRIIREKGAKFSDFVIIARDTAPYEDALSIACKRNKIKCFIDKKLPLISMPVSATVLSAISYILKPTAEGILNFHKSGIDVLSLDEINKLENYCFIWNISGKDFHKQWDMNPAGFTERKPENAEDILAEINKIRIKAITPLDIFKGEFLSTPKQKTTAIINLLKNVGAKDSFERLYNEYDKNGEKEYAEAFLSSYSAFISLLDSIILCFPDTKIDNKVYFNTLENSLKSESIGITPQTLDQTIFGASDRIRPAKPKYAFIMGANRGVFPKTEAPSGLFSNSEFSKLKSAGLNIPDRTETMAIDEELLVYANCCCASNEVYITYTSFTADGSAAIPSLFVDEIVSKLKVNLTVEPKKLGYDNLPETIDGALIDFCKSKEKNNQDTETLREVLRQSGKQNEISSIDGDVTAENVKLQRETASLLYGKSLHMYPSNFETYSRCKFSFFCRYGLRADKLYKSDFNAMQQGTFIHYVLQRIIETYKKGISELDEKQITEAVDKFCAEYINSIKGFSSVENIRTKYIVSNMARRLRYIVSRLALEFSQSEFEPKKCELKIGKNSDIPEIRIELDNGKEITLGGTVDRIDTYKDFVRIVDYKTGAKEFDLPDILYGQNMQMLLYLYAVTNSGKYGKNPAGILYMGAKRVKDGAPAKRRMNGLLVADEEIATAMEKDNKGEFIPKFNSEKMGNSYITAEDFANVFEFINKKLKTAGSDIFEGKIDAKPIDGLNSPACKYCDFHTICRISKDKIGAVPKMTNGEVMETIKKGE